ncbi:MAG: ORF6N domain-containing protein [Gemmatimonadetes bacterium]|nr:ORF6N domain-containing protein [Gemmatimonadota bacterium]
MISVERITAAIHLVRGYRVMLNGDLAEFYGVSIKRLNEAVKPQRSRFPGDFMFLLSSGEEQVLRSQIATLELGRGRRPRAAPSRRSHGCELGRGYPVQTDSGATRW